MSDVTDAISLFFYSLRLNLFISPAGLLPALSNAAGVHFNPPWIFAPLITNWAVPYRAVPHLDAHLAKVMTSLYTQSMEVLKQWWEEEVLRAKRCIQEQKLW